MKSMPIIRIFRFMAPHAGVLCLCCMMFIPGRAAATSEEMLKLPTYNTFQCAICHVASHPTGGSSELNAFGVDFLMNGKIWNKALAIKNSDGDNCPNGFELADLNGDGTTDEPGAGENSNPGKQDCTIALSKQTWGIIKELFSGE